MTIFTEEQHNDLVALFTSIDPNFYETIHDRMQQMEDLAAQEGSEEDYEHLLWLLAESMDWELTYRIDWKDTESCVQCLQQLADNWSYRLTFGVDNPLDEDFLDSTDVESLLVAAQGELEPLGLSIWGWDTASDMVCGWIARSRDAYLFAQLSDRLGVEIRKGGIF